MTDWMTSTSDWERNTMLKIAKRGRSLSFRCCLSAAGLNIFYLSLYLLRFFKNINQPQRNLVYRLGNLQRSPFYEITYFIQLSGGTYSILANYTIDSFVSILVLQVCAQLINLRTTLNNLVNELVSKSISSSRFRKGLAAIAVRHDHLISMYAYCYSAERLMTESTKMTYGVYECKWYDIPPKHAKDLMFIICRSRIPLRLTIGKFGIFSLEMFGKVRCIYKKKIYYFILKTSMGYLSALLAMRE
ncbi:PREDICTED: uncharacterized protein LOC108772385 [Cyphomyrmex costatus]|uniref:uncharacterized protein LOC108772385 n=1 Tax=Cyphomyrmex costatus TaxID=456900 RepID=UPI000852306C|nr:PREDICTED: uncharacterized protein LOC108772385 [Cyphomyrmex costatus]